MAEWRFLYNYYDGAKCYVKTQNEKSEMFRTKWGVKQGGPMSPLLYNIYTQDLIIEIEKMQLGAMINKIQISTIMYADDVIIISPTKAGIKIC